ncbi:hypothetical protein PIB30_061236 [Stylosanthes scabra]|uniref:Putative plant transposon protein domain-containing protein n=1 Tax=Stylosanthes scabra TaxID=79078 RepID=A0ABU6UMG3_9FABA|nr:hypothetical protein [Stylosanthes scabra]
MLRRRQSATDEATSSRGRPSRNSIRARQDTFPNERFDHQLHFDRWKGMENRGIVHERIVRVDGNEGPIFRNRIQELGWGFIFGDLVRTNLSMLREFCTNFSSASQNHVYLREKKIPFTEAHIHSYLGIPGDAPDADIDDAFIVLAKAYKRGEDVNMGAIYVEIGRPETNWADNPTDNTIPNKINNSVLNAKATAWHKIIMANIDPKTHGTKFDLKHAFLIYVLMTSGDVNLPRLMRDILLARPTKHPNHLLPFLVFFMRVANRHELPEFPDDKFYRKSLRGAKKNKEARKMDKKPKKSPTQRQLRACALDMARPRPPFLNMEVSNGGALVRPRWCARATPSRNAQDKDLVRLGWRARAATTKLT